MDTTDPPLEEPPELLRAKLVTETARIEWRSLQRHFAGGHVVHVVDDADLVEVAHVIARDDAAALERMMRAGEVSRMSDDTARAWYDSDALVWCVVARPWVIVQATRAGDDAGPGAQGSGEPTA